MAKTIYDLGNELQRKEKIKSINTVIQYIPLAELKALLDYLHLITKRRNEEYRALCETRQVYSREECIFNYCSEPEICRKNNKCSHPKQLKSANND